jgi:hypothetical protein
MSERWEVYACQMGDHRAFVSYDHGIAEEIDGLKAQLLVKVRIPFHLPNARGLPQGPEFAGLNAVKDEFNQFASDHGGNRRWAYLCEQRASPVAYVDVDPQAAPSSSSSDRGRGIRSGTSAIPIRSGRLTGRSSTLPRRIGRSLKI